MQRPFVSTVLLISSGLALYAQPARLSNLSGKVLDPAGAAVPAAEVRLYSRDNAVHRFAQSGADGAWRIDQLPGGDFLVEARTQGLDQARPVSVRILPGQDQSLDLTLAITTLSTRVQVTASTTPLTAAETGKAVDVLDRADLDRRAEFSFTEALRVQPALRVQQLGGPGSFTRIQSRGLRAADTAVLVDGARLRDPAAVQGDAAAYMGDLMLIGTEKIEVLRGSGSSLYGTNAIGAAVNMVTDQGGGKIRGELGGEGGGLGLFRGNARLAGGLLEDRLQYSAALAHLNVNGGIDGVESVRNTGAQGYLQFRPTSTTSLSGRVFATGSTIGVNSSPYAAPISNLPSSTFVPAIPLPEDQVRLADQGRPFAWGNATFAPNIYDPDSRRTGSFTTTMLQWTHQVSPRVSYRAFYNSLLSDRDNRNGPAGAGFQPAFNTSSAFNGRIDTAQGRIDLALSRTNLLSAGYEFERESYESISSDENPSPASRVNARTTAVQRSNTVFVQDQIRLLNERLQISLSGRLQSFQLRKPVFEGGAPIYDGAPLNSPPNAYTGDASISYFLPASSTKLRAHAGNGYRVPALYERFGSYFFFGQFSALGDPRLAPERTIGFDFGFDQYFARDRVRAGATYFYTRLQQVIGYAGLTNDPFGRFGGYVNLGGGLSRGLELSAEARPWRSLLVQGSYTYTNADERSPFLLGGVLSAIRVFPHQYTAVATQQIGKRIQVTADFLAASDYISGVFFVGGGNRPFTFPGPRRVDLSTSYTLPVGESSHLRFYLRAENIGNQRYFEDGFRTPRAWASAGLKFLF